MSVALNRLSRLILVIATLHLGALAAHADVESPTAKLIKPNKDEALFLDRLMQAESGGRLDAKNPRSSALGPFQFIQSTFHHIVMRYLPELAEGKTYPEIQQLRTDLEASRLAALIYTRENAAYLNERGVAPEPGFLRLAFLLGPNGAAKVIAAEPKTPVSDLLSSAAVDANPFMRNMSAEQLIDRAKREAAGLNPLPLVALAKAKSAHPKINVRCNLRLASCRKWLALAKKRLARKIARTERREKSAAN
jgi:hypothetical protein